MIRALFAGSRFVAGLAIVSTFAGSVVLLLLSAIAVLRGLFLWISPHDAHKDDSLPEQTT